LNDRRPRLGRPPPTSRWPNVRTPRRSWRPRRGAITPVPS